MNIYIFFWLFVHAAMPGKESEVQSLAFGAISQVWNMINPFLIKPINIQVAILIYIINFIEGCLTWIFFLNMGSHVYNSIYSVHVKLFVNFCKCYFYINVLTLQRNPEDLSFFPQNICELMLICLWIFSKSIRKIRPYFPD